MAWALLMYMGNYWAFDYVESTQQRADVIAYYIAASEDERFAMEIFCRNENFPDKFDVDCLKESDFNLNYVKGEEVLLKKQHSIQYLAFEVFLIPVLSLIFLFLLIKLFSSRDHRNQSL